MRLKKPAVEEMSSKCGICRKAVGRGSASCSRCGSWVHLRCTKTSFREAKKMASNFLCLLCKESNGKSENSGDDSSSLRGVNPSNSVATNSGIPTNVNSEPMNAVNTTVVQATSVAPTFVKAKPLDTALGRLTSNASAYYVKTNGPSSTDVQRTSVDAALQRVASNVCADVTAKHLNTAFGQATTTLSTGIKANILNTVPGRENSNVSTGVKGNSINTVPGPTTTKVSTDGKLPSLAPGQANTNVSMGVKANPINTLPGRAAANVPTVLKANPANTVPEPAASNGNEEPVNIPIRSDIVSTAMTARPTNVVIKTEPSNNAGTDDAVIALTNGTVTGSSVSVDVERHLECSICMEQFSKPKMLSCLHTFCEKCLLNLTKVVGSELRPVQCPICRHITKIEKGVSSLPTNWVIKKEVDCNTLQTSVKHDRIYCTECESCKASNFCKNCQLNLCKTCTKYHKRVIRSRYHDVVVLKDMLDADIASAELVLCGLHKQVLKYYCETCNVSLCFDCTLSNTHTSHGLKVIGDVAREKLEDLKRVIERAKIKEVAFKNTLEDAKRVLKEAHSSKERSVKVVEDSFANIASFLDTAKLQLVNWLESGTKASEVSVANASKTFNIFERMIEYAEGLANTNRQEDVIGSIMKTSKMMEKFLNAAAVPSNPLTQQASNIVGGNIINFTKDPLVVNVVNREVQKVAALTQIANHILSISDVRASSKGVQYFNTPEANKSKVPKFHPYAYPTFNAPLKCTERTFYELKK